MAGKTRKGSMAKINEDCGKCDVIVEDTDEAVVCDICQSWFHRECGQISKELFDAIDKFGAKGSKEIPWQCKICRKVATGLIAEMNLLKQKHDKLEKKLKDVEKKVLNNEKQMNEEIKVLTEKVKSGTMFDEIKLKQKIKEEVNEASQIEKKKNKIIISNLNYETEKEDLRKKVESLILSLGTNPGNIGSINSLSDKNLISVEINDIAEKIKILKNSSKLKDSQIYKNVFIRQDLTYLQRKENKMLREEMKRRTENGEKNLKIIRGQLVQVQVPQSP